VWVWGGCKGAAAAAAPARSQGSPRIAHQTSVTRTKNMEHGKQGQTGCEQATTPTATEPQPQQQADGRLRSHSQSHSTATQQAQCTVQAASASEHVSLASHVTFRRRRHDARSERNKLSRAQQPARLHWFHAPWSRARVGHFPQHQKVCANIPKTRAAESKYSTTANKKKLMCPREAALSAPHTRHSPASPLPLPRA
jgi:hypothetical protein